MGEQSIEIVRGIYDAFGRGDVQAVLGAMRDELEWYEAEGLPYGGPYRDREAVAEKVFGPLIEDIPNFEVSPEKFIASGGTVAAVVPLHRLREGYRQAARPPGRARLGYS